MKKKFLQNLKIGNLFIISVFSLLIFISSPSFGQKVLSWAKSINGNGNDYSVTLTKTTNNCVYFGGYFTSTNIDFDPGPGLRLLSSNGGEDIFVTNFDKKGKYKKAFNIGIRHISISSSGIIEGIERLAQEPLQINLAISLHAPTNDLRTSLMPVNKTYPIEEVLKAVDKYVKKTKRKVMFEYLMIDKINDSPVQAEQLAKIMENPLYFVNLISFNPIGHSKFRPSPGYRIKEFKQVLEGFGVNVTQRYRFGREIKGACGQLASDN